MALGTITVVEQMAAQGPLFMDRVTIVGDDAYASGGSAGVEAAFQAAVGSEREIVGIINDDSNGDALLQYDHANDKLLVRLISTGAESAVSDQSGTTYKLTVISK